MSIIKRKLKSLHTLISSKPRIPCWLKSCKSIITVTQPTTSSSRCRCLQCRRRELRRRRADKYRLPTTRNCLRSHLLRRRLKIRRRLTMPVFDFHLSPRDLLRCLRFTFQSPNRPEQRQQRQKNISTPHHCRRFHRDLHQLQPKPLRRQMSGTPCHR